MTAPSVSWYDRPATSALPNWSIGVVDAGTVSADMGITIWNNKGGSTALSDMQNCTITTKDAAGGNTGELVLNKWVEVKVDSLSETTFSAIGGVGTHPIQAKNQAAGIISGAVNDGTRANAIGNYAEITVHANVPSNASAGTVNFKLRAAYQFT
jgi:hypothetical protein